MIRSRPKIVQDSASLRKIFELQRCAVDPVYFIETFLMIQHPVKGSIRFRLNPEQFAIAESFKSESRTTMVMKRQGGSTTVALALTLWSALFGSAGGTVGFATMNHRMCEDAMQTLQGWIQDLPAYMRPQIITANRSELRLENNSRIIARPISMDSFRGQSLSILVVDGLSYVREADRENFLDVVLPLYWIQKFLFVDTKELQQGFRL